MTRADAIAAMTADGIPTADQTEAAIQEYMGSVTDPFAGVAMPTPAESDADIAADEAALAAEAQSNTLPAQIAAGVAGVAQDAAGIAKVL